MLIKIRISSLFFEQYIPHIYICFSFTLVESKKDADCYPFDSWKTR